MPSLNRPIRIGNAAGAIGDGIDQVYHLAKAGMVDAITADNLAEFNLAWRAIDLRNNPDLGYEPNFLEQLSWNSGNAARFIAQKGIKVVHNGGALNPKGLAKKVDEYFKSLHLNNTKVAWVGGDDLTNPLRRGDLGNVGLLDHPDQKFDSASADILAANAYTGMAGIVKALEEGADIVICGRCCDASPVMGLAYWWHGWKSTDYDQVAGSLMAGHLIECGAYVTGGNFCGAKEIQKLHHVGYPIAEIASDGTSVITKPNGTNGAVTIDTCKAQLLYEIQGSKYLNPDVIAHIENVKLREESEHRIELTGVRGSPPPRTTKLAICVLGGWQAEISAYCAGLDTDFKFQLMKDQVMGQINANDFTTFSIEKYGSQASNPRSQQECTVQIRLFAQSTRKEAMTEFRRAVFYNGMQGYCGLHLSMDWRTMEPRPYVKYFPALIEQSRVPLSVEFVGSPGKLFVGPRESSLCESEPVVQPNYEPLGSFGIYASTVSRPLGDLVFARSGDKGGNANVGFWVRDAESWPWLQLFLTTPRLIDLLGDDWDDRYSVERCEFPELWAVHFVVKGILQEGVSSSSVLDGFGKSFGEFLRARHVELPRNLVEKETVRRRQTSSIQDLSRL